MTENLSVVGYLWIGQSGKGIRITERYKGLLEVRNMFTILNIGMVSQVNTYVGRYQIVDFIHMQFHCMSVILQ